MSSRRRRIILWVLAVLTTASAITLPLRFLEARSSGWPFTDGIIKSSRLVEGELNGEHLFRAQLEYIYFVDLREFTNWRLDFHDGDRVESAEAAQALLKQYPPGQKVRVYYDRSHPESAVLRPGLTGDGRWIAWLNLALVALFGLALAGLIVQGRRAARAKG